MNNPATTNNIGHSKHFVVNKSGWYRLALVIQRGVFLINYKTSIYLDPHFKLIFFSLICCFSLLYYPRIVKTTHDKAHLTTKLKFKFCKFNFELKIVFVKNSWGILSRNLYTTVFSPIRILFHQLSRCGYIKFYKSAQLSSYLGQHFFTRVQS